MGQINSPAYNATICRGKDGERMGFVQFSNTTDINLALTSLDGIHIDNNRITVSANVFADRPIVIVWKLGNDNCFKHEQFINAYDTFDNLSKDKFEDDQVEEVNKINAMFDSDSE